MHLKSNSKAEYIMGHSLQVIAILAQRLNTCFAVPLIGQIHEGIKFHCEKTHTLLNKMFNMLIELNLTEGFYFVADKYYCSGRLMKQLVEQNIHIVTMMKRNAVAYFSPVGPTKKRRGRPTKYGPRVKLFNLFTIDLSYITAPMPGNDKLMIEYHLIYLLWRPLGKLAQFVLVKHPEKGLSIVMSTDLTAPPLSLITIYALRFKNGEILNSVDKAIKWASTMTWKGIKASVGLIDKVYKKGASLTKAKMKQYQFKIKRSSSLQKWYVRILPQAE